MIDKASQVKRASILVQKLCETDFYGRLEIRFEHGNIVHITKIASIKIDAITEEEIETGS